MNAVLLSTIEGLPIASLLMSKPISEVRDCVFVVAARNAETFESPEARVILPDRPAEYRCSYTSSKIETQIRFENQNGWDFVVVVQSDGAGHWSATKDGQRLGGLTKAF